MEFTLVEANAYANQMLYYPALPDTHTQYRCTWPEVEDASRLALSSYTGDEHKEILVAHTCRREEDDLKLAVSYAISQFRRRMDEEIRQSGDKAKIEWRRRPEVIVENLNKVARYHEDGLDEDFLTAKLCTLDHRFWVVKVYARCSFVPEKYIAVRKLYLANSKAV